MTPLDTGHNPDLFTPADSWQGARTPQPPLSIMDYETLGQGLRHTREALGRSLADMVGATCIPARYLTALEGDDAAAMPSRAFAIGHLKTYARALGLDEHLAVERFKAEVPLQSEALRAPTGTEVSDVRRRSPLWFAVAGVIVAAVAGWNVYQHVSNLPDPRPTTIAETPETWSLGQVPGVTRLGAPTPAPRDQTIPALYITPGLEEALAPFAETAAVGETARDDAPVQAAFNPRGAIYGAEPRSSYLTIQARRPASLVVRMNDGRVLFARQLATGEAYRAPRGAAAVIDVSDPGAFDLYLNGEHAGRLTAALTPLAPLNTRGEQQARQAAAVIAADAERARVALQAEAAPAAPAPATATPSAAPATSGPISYAEALRRDAD